MWGPHFTRHHVLFCSDNEAVVYILNSRKSKIPVLMCFLCHLLASVVHFNFSFSSQHVPMVHNCIADALSHFHWQEFQRLAPKAQSLPVPIPPQLLEELLGPHQSNSASSFWSKVWLTPLGYLTYLARGSSSSSGSWASFTPVALRARLTNGHCACFQLSWLDQFSTLLSLSSPFITYPRGLPRPSGQLSLFRAGHSRNQMDPRFPEAQRLPITNDILMIIFRALDLLIFDHCMFWAVCNLAYFGFLRSAEFTVPNLASFSPALHLSIRDILVDSDANPFCLRVRIKASKTDSFWKGCFVYIGRGRFPLCALQAALAYLAVRGNSGGPLFLCQDGWPLSCTILTTWIREILVGVGVPGNFSSHSICIGAATVVARSGIPDHLIQALYRLPVVYSHSI